ncbi:hypothetical protein V8E36_004232 [Tilletia maclaganii]
MPDANGPSCLSDLALAFCPSFASTGTTQVSRSLQPASPVAMLPSTSVARIHYANVTGFQPQSTPDHCPSYPPLSSLSDLSHYRRRFQVRETTKEHAAGFRNDDDVNDDAGAKSNDGSIEDGSDADAGGSSSGSASSFVIISRPPTTTDGTSSDSASAAPTVLLYYADPDPDSDSDVDSNEVQDQPARQPIKLSGLQLKVASNIITSMVPQVLQLIEVLPPSDHSSGSSSTNLKTVPALQQLVKPHKSADEDPPADNTPPEDSPSPPPAPPHRRPPLTGKTASTTWATTRLPKLRQAAAAAGLLPPFGDGLWHPRFKLQDVAGGGGSCSSNTAAACRRVDGRPSRGRSHSICADAELEL